MTIRNKILSHKGVWEEQIETKIAIHNLVGFPRKSSIKGKHYKWIPIL